MVLKSLGFHEEQPYGETQKAGVESGPYYASHGELGRQTEKGPGTRLDTEGDTDRLDEAISLLDHRGTIGSGSHRNNKGSRPRDNSAFCSHAQMPAAQLWTS